MIDARDAVKRYITLRYSADFWLLTLLQILAAYEKQGFEMLLKAFNDSGYLESLTGLDKLHDEGDAVLESIDWDEDEEDM